MTHTCRSVHGYDSCVNLCMTKPIDAERHAILDYLTAGAFIAGALYYRNRHARASALAWMNGLSVLALSVFTDYPGGLVRTVSFQTPGVIDALQAGMSAAGPALMGFAGDPEASPFYAQAVVETGVISATDFSNG